MKIQCETGIIVEVDGETLIGADLRNKNLHRAIFTGLSMQGILLQGSILRGANFNDADLTGADLSATATMTSSFLRATLREVNFENAKPIAATFEGANLHKARFKGADVGNANFRNADLTNADMRCERLESANLEGAVMNNVTLWPVGFNAASKGVRYK